MHLELDTFSVSCVARSPIPDDGQDPVAVTGWGKADAPGMFYIGVNSSQIRSYTPPGFRIVGVVFVMTGDIPMRDVPVSKSAALDIENSDFYVPIKVDRSTLPPDGTRVIATMHYALLLVPERLNPDRFKTIREAQELGAKFIWHGGSNLPGPR